MNEQRGRIWAVAGIRALCGALVIVALDSTFTAGTATFTKCYWLTAGLLWAPIFGSGATNPQMTTAKT
jgi:hypothetical protein